jgi:hypothetical protein
MKRSRKPIKSHSDRGAEYQDEYHRNSLIVLKRANYRCQIMAAHDCEGFASDQPHHRKFRSQGGSNSPTHNLLAVCQEGHMWIHQVLPRDMAEHLDLIVPNYMPEHFYDGKDHR